MVYLLPDFLPCFELEFTASVSKVSKQQPKMPEAHGIGYFP